MKSLYDYELLQNEVFYRSEYILKYLERHQTLSDLDKAAIANTILDALVTKGLIDPAKQSLDLDCLAIVNDLNHIPYNPTPLVSSIPLDIKEKMRHKCVIISAGIPLSIFCSKPSGPVHFCIYDMNTAFSTLFPSFKFIVCDYDSPTRKGARATERPFVEVNINGEDYLVDLLTKRIFKSSWFKAKFNLTITREISPETYNSVQKAYYAEKTEEHQDLASYLLLMEILNEGNQNNPRLEETLYEIEQSKKNFPNVFDELEAMKADMRSLDLTGDIERLIY